MPVQSQKKKSTLKLSLKQERILKNYFFLKFIGLPIWLQAVCVLKASTKLHPQQWHKDITSFSMSTISQFILRRSQEFISLIGSKEGSFRGNV